MHSQCGGVIHTALRGIFKCEHKPENDLRKADRVAAGVTVRVK